MTAAAAWLTPVALADTTHEDSDAQAIAGQSFYQGKSEGWFWYQTYPDPVPPVQEKPAPPPPPPPAPEPVSKVDQAPTAPFTSAWIRLELPKFRDRAMDDPTPENVRAYYYLQRFFNGYKIWIYDR